ncbi:basic salivary proline-rich protein 2-like [Homarus americanus]|uniref:basic salivary proline-rich protein 2-like n=1 Tax=Homarus americanus TaxID=6706 RepID=UPI001C45D086|nr:basic salivary proline-rich protein 2-like [Homarus americanus]
MGPPRYVVPFMDNHRGGDVPRRPSQGRRRPQRSSIKGVGAPMGPTKCDGAPMSAPRGGGGPKGPPIGGGALECPPRSSWGSALGSLPLRDLPRCGSALTNPPKGGGALSGPPRNGQSPHCLLPEA